MVDEDFSVFNVLGFPTRRLSASLKPSPSFAVGIVYLSGSYQSGYGEVYQFAERAQAPPQLLVPVWRHPRSSRCVGRHFDRGYPGCRKIFGGRSALDNASVTPAGDSAFNSQQRGLRLLAVRLVGRVPNLGGPHTFCVGWRSAR